MSSRFDDGIRVRRAVLGEAHVERSMKNRTAFDADFVSLVTESAWGTLWARETISRRERSMLTLAILAALGHHEEFVYHLRGTANTGASMEDVKEALLHVAIYAGIPAANTAFRIAKQTFAEMEAAKAADPAQ
jgi:4-carboxymuconolactone decarboxylase